MVRLGDFTHRPCSDLVPIPGHGARALKWTLCTHASALNKNVHKQLGKGNNYREISGKYAVVALTAYEKVNTAGTDENLFRLVPVPGHGARVLPSGASARAWARCPSTTSGASARAWAR